MKKPWHSLKTYRGWRQEAQISWRGGILPEGSARVPYRGSVTKILESLREACVQVYPTAARITGTLFLNLLLRPALVWEKARRTFLIGLGKMSEDKIWKKQQKNNLYRHRSQTCPVITQIKE